jgi:hypothetical protein
MVDTRFFESEDDIVKSNTAVENATSFAIEFINGRRGQLPDGSLVPNAVVDGG